jgi:hypothetical protein
LERVDVDGKFGLVYSEESGEHEAHTTIILPPIYNKIEIRKIFSPKAIYKKYAVFADGTKVGQFTLVLNS